MEHTHTLRLSFPGEGKICLQFSRRSSSQIPPPFPSDETMPTNKGKSSSKIKIVIAEIWPSPPHLFGNRDRRCDSRIMNASFSIISFHSAFLSLLFQVVPSCLRTCLSIWITLSRGRHLDPFINTLHGRPTYGTNGTAEAIEWPRTTCSLLYTKVPLPVIFPPPLRCHLKKISNVSNVCVCVSRYK
jgi:hypothetical protein